MSVYIKPCNYKTNDSQINRLVDFKCEYLCTNSYFIRSTLEAVEQLIVFRVGSIDAILQKISSSKILTEEEKEFAKQIKEFLS